jgi:hypothetical protein
MPILREFLSPEVIAKSRKRATSLIFMSLCQPTVVKNEMSETTWHKKNGQRLGKARNRAVPPHVRHRIEPDIINGSLSMIPVCLRHR